MRVSDNGAGMGPDLLQSLFKPFTQGTQSLDRPQGGLGLGLAIAREVIELHGGSIDASSDGEGLGLQILVRLPAQALSAAASEACDVAHVSNEGPNDGP